MPIFYSAMMLTGVNLLLRLVSTSFQVFLSGRIGAEGIGLLQLVMSVGMMAMTAGTAGIRTTAMYLTAEELGRKKAENVSAILSGCYVYSILCSTAVSILLTVFAPAIADRWIGDLRTIGAIRLFAAFLPVSCLCGVMTGIFTAENRIGTLAAVEAAEQVCSMAITLYLLTFFAGSDPGRSCMAVVTGSGIGACLTLTLLVILHIRSMPQKRGRIPVASRLLQIAVPLALADDLKSGISTTENLMVPKRLSLYPGTGSALGQFGTVCGMVFPVMMFPAAILFSLAELLIPELARCSAAGSRTRIHYLVRRTLRTATLYGVCMGGLLFLLSDWLCQALYHSSDAATYLRMFAFLVPMIYCDCVTDAMTKGLGQQRANVRYNIITSAMDVAMLFFLLPRLGMTGYFLSFLISHLVNFILSLRRLLLITEETIPFSVPALTCAAGLLSAWAAGHFVHPILRGMGFVVFLSALLCLFGILRKDDLVWLRRLITQKQPAD